MGSKEAMRLDLGRFLGRTGHFDIEAGERLRQLAMHLEPSVAADSTGLEALERIYGEAARLSPESSEVWHSRGISAKYIAQASRDEGLVGRGQKIAERALHKAWALDPGDAFIAYSIGRWHYEFRTPGCEARDWFERAIELDPKLASPKMYRAHCLQDNAQWEAALAAYESVPLDRFTGRNAWLVDIVLEAQAYCRLRTGDREGALREFRQLLERISKEPGRGQTLLLKYVSEVCEGELAVELGAQWARLDQRLNPTLLD